MEWGWRKEIMAPRICHYLKGTFLAASIPFVDLRNEALGREHRPIASRQRVHLRERPPFARARTSSAAKRLWFLTPKYYFPSWSNTAYAELRFSMSAMLFRILVLAILESRSAPA